MSSEDCIKNLRSDQRVYDCELVRCWVLRCISENMNASINAENMKYASPRLMLVYISNMSVMTCFWVEQNIKNKINCVKPDFMSTLRQKHHNNRWCSTFPWSPLARILSECASGFTNNTIVMWSSRRGKKESDRQIMRGISEESDIISSGSSGSSSCTWEDERRLYVLHFSS